MSGGNDENRFKKEGRIWQQTSLGIKVRVGPI